MIVFRLTQSNLIDLIPFLYLMRYKIIVAILSVLIISVTITLVLIFYPYSPPQTEIEPPNSRFSSLIIRDVPDESYLSYLLTNEALTSQEPYFDMLSNDSKSFIHNVSNLIQEELEYLEIFDPSEYYENQWRYHNFTYIGNVIPEVDYIDFISMYNLTEMYPYFFFYYNFTSAEYHANSTLTFGYDPADWLIPESVEYLFNQNETYILVTQFVKISEIYAPLAGTGTTFERQILCLETGQPVFFLSNEGPWWIS